MLTWFAFIYSLEEILFEPVSVETRDAIQNDASRLSRGHFWNIRSEHSPHETLILATDIILPAEGDVAVETYFRTHRSEDRKRDTGEKQRHPHWRSKVFSAVKSRACIEVRFPRS